MTQKDFIELSAQLVIAKAELDQEWRYNPYERDIAEKQWRDCVYAVMLACKATSANFDRGKFLTACGVPNIGIK